MDDQPLAPLRPTPGREQDDADDDARRRRTLDDGEPPAQAPPRPSRRSALWLLLILLVVAAVVAWVVLRGTHQAAPSRRMQSTGPMPVGTTKVASGDMPVLLNALGTVTPLATVTVQTQLN